MVRTMIRQVLIRLSSPLYKVWNRALLDSLQGILRIKPLKAFAVDYCYQPQLSAGIYLHLNSRFEPLGPIKKDLQ